MCFEGSMVERAEMGALWAVGRWNKPWSKPCRCSYRLLGSLGPCRA